MYLDFYGFTKTPFQITPDKDFLYMSKQHARALVYMDYSAWKPGGFVVITGEIGSGKTTLVKWLIKNFSDKANCLQVSFTNLSGNDLFNLLLRQLNVISKKDDKVSLIYTLKEYLIRLEKSGKPTVLIIDEAQNLTQDQLEDIRMLAALEGENGPLLRVTLLAQPEFLYMINSMEQFKQRVKLHYHLKGLNLDDVKKYIEYRLAKSGIQENTLFDDHLIEKIYEHSKGIPRLINKICDALLMCSYAEEKKKPSIVDIDSILPDLMMLPGKPNYQKTINKGSEANFASDHMLERLVNAVEGLNKNISVIAEKLKL